MTSDGALLLQQLLRYVISRGESCVSEGLPSRRVPWKELADEFQVSERDLLNAILPVAEEGEFGTETHDDGRKYLVLTERMARRLDAASSQEGESQ